MKKHSIADRILFACACTFAFALLEPCAVAQNIPTPGQVREQLRTPPSLPTTGAPSVAPTLPPAAGSSVAPGGRAVLVSGFDISGNHSVESAVLQQVIAGYVGRPLTLAEIYDAADELTRYYRTSGYTLASAYVPEQKIGAGIIRIEILEGTLGAVKIEGTGRTRPGFLNWQLDRLRSGEVLRNEPLENELLLLNDIPGLHARAVVQPGTEFGKSDLVLKTDEKRFDGGAQYDNYGRESIGESRLLGNAGLNGLLGYGDRLDLNAVYAEGDLLHYGRAGYSLPITRWGTRASIYYAAYEYQVDAKKLGFPDLDIAGDGDNFGIRIDHPFWRSRTTNLYFGFGLDRTNTDQRDKTAPAAILHTKQNLTLANFSAYFSYLASDESYSTIGANLSTNFEGNPLNRTAQGQFRDLENNAQTAKLQLDLSHYRKLYRQLAWSTRFSGVASINPLVDLERFRIGGANSVRGFASSELAGDSGFLLSTELQHPVPFVTALPTLVKVFFDTGRVYHKNYNLRAIAHQGESISGAGLGLQTSLYGKFFFDVAIAEPIGAHDTSDTDRGPRVWANVSAKF